MMFPQIDMMETEQVFVTFVFDTSLMKPITQKKILLPLSSMKALNLTPLHLQFTTYNACSKCDCCTWCSSW